MSSQPAADFSVVSSEHIFHGYAFDLRTDKVRMPEGSVATRDVVEHLGAVAVLAIDDQDNVSMVFQYRHPVGQQLLELPAGLLDVNGEPALDTAKRELYEEASLTATDWRLLLDLHTSPGTSSEAIRIYLARGLAEVAESDRFVAEHEELAMTVRRYPLGQLIEMALSGELTNAPAVAAVLAAQVARPGDWAGLRQADAPWPARPDRVPATAD
ncbi:MAG: NUDIX hydrolase [Actinomycetota bacterium]|nr:NUDIX hydrolase [Actinomycetota bacterium]MDQ2958195.1 NUDIX hydrolase [Actinomycetota bacterium]